MIISASRRTDIPDYFSEWLYNRIRDGYVLSRNPMNPKQIGKISLSPEVIDCIVFWTKNPEPMMARLSELKEYNYYFQFTLTPYGTDIEPNLPEKSQVIETFKRLSDILSPDRVIWRYDPILINPACSKEYHYDNFSRMADILKGYTKTCTISFIDEYQNTRANAAKLGLLPISDDDMLDMSARLSDISLSQGIIMQACAEKIDLASAGVRRASCIDKDLIEKITGCAIDAARDKYQRPECGCIESIDIGAYNTCPNRCLYCYANYNANAVHDRFSAHDPKSPMLFGTPAPEDTITERNIKSFIKKQIAFEMD